jgi:NTE family protein
MATRARRTKPRAPKRARTKAGPRSKTINLALQGGGAHGAFTWGVLDRLLECGRVDFDGICGTSAGAMNAVVMAYGLMQGGHDGAREALAVFWKKVSASGEIFNPVRPSPGLAGVPGVDPQVGMNVSHWLFESFTRVFSPYQFNPFDFNPLRHILTDCVDFAALKQCTAAQVFLCATNVRSGKVHIFDNKSLSVDAVLASACLPFLWQAVEVEGEHYWDGGYMGNPALFPLFYNTAPRDVLIVMVNPLHRDRIPTNAVEINDRVNEITFNSSLLREMRAVEFVGRLIEEGWIKSEYASRMRRVLVHIVRADPELTEFGVSSKLSPDWRFLTHLRDLGRKSASAWLDAHWDDIGERPTIDIRKEFL